MCSEDAGGYDVIDAGTCHHRSSRAISSLFATVTTPAFGQALGVGRACGFDDGMGRWGGRRSTAAGSVDRLSSEATGSVE